MLMTRILILTIFASLSLCRVRAQDSAPSSRDLLRWSLTVPTPADSAVCESAHPLPQIPDYKLTADWKKSRRLKRAAWITLGVGAFIAAAGTAAGILAFDEDGLVTVPIWLSTWFVGGLSMLSSVPLFITSHHFKTKAKRSVDISLNATGFCETTPIGRSALGLALTFWPSLTGSDAHTSSFIKSIPEDAARRMARCSPTFSASPAM